VRRRPGIDGVAGRGALSRRAARHQFLCATLSSIICAKAPISWQLPISFACLCICLLSAVRVFASLCAASKSSLSRAVPLRTYTLFAASRPAGRLFSAGLYPGRRPPP
jgi:hypothetical protein